MRKINFKEINMLTALVSALDEALSNMQTGLFVRETEVRSAAQAYLYQEAGRSLEQVPVEELRQSKAGIRVGALSEAGYKNLKDLADADDAALMTVNGIGEKQVASIRTVIAAFRVQIAQRKTVRLSLEDPSEENMCLIRALAIFRMSSEICQETVPVQREFHDRVEQILPGIVIRNSLRWLFSGRKTKESTVLAIEELAQFASSQLYERAGRLQGRYQDLENLTLEEGKKDFEQHGAEYSVLLERFFENAADRSSFRGGLSADLAASIDAYRIDLSCFAGSLRGYQEFGVKYILHQKRVLLGDDMGLGKTVQAIAAAAHLHAQDTGAHFLIICPAGVLINWEREIRKFSRIPVLLLYGKGIMEALRQWLETGGAALTSYEMIGRVIDQINDRADVSMLIVDEAHYIKNPKALRTRNVRMLEDEAKRILLMTGTPLENRVSEMCSLIDFIRPDLAGEVREAVGLCRTQEFREKISPLYLRRRREEVLTELPEVEVKEEWCSMTQEDEDAYARQILEGNFMGARRVSFLQENLETSAKAERLKELCREAEAAGRKIILYSYFRETIAKAADLLKDRCAGTITGSTDPSHRQEIVDGFAHAPDGSVLVCQVQAGGTGLNIQAASIVLFCEPQIKPSLMHQAVARAWRMGQVRNVQVHFLLCENTVDEAVMELLEEKQLQFDLYADESAIAQAAEELVDTDWISAFMEKEHQKYLPAVIQ